MSATLLIGHPEPVGNVKTAVKTSNSAQKCDSVFFDSEGHAASLNETLDAKRTRQAIPEERDFFEQIEANQKTTLLELQQSGVLSGKLRDTTGRYGPAKEYFPFTVSFDTEDSGKFTEENMERFREIVKDVLSADPEGRRSIIISGVHTDTGNIHVQGYMHAFAIDVEHKTVSTSRKLSRNSEAAEIANRLHKALLEAELSGISNVIVGNRSIYTDRATGVTPEDKAAAAEALEAAGGQVTPAYAVGPVQPVTEKPKIEISPERDMIEAAIKAATQTQQKATADLLRYQHALAAIEQKDELESELKTVKSELSDKSTTLQNTEKELQDIEESLSNIKTVLKKTSLTLHGTNKTLTSTKKEKTEISQQLSVSQHEKAKLDAALSGLKADYESLEDDFNELQSKHDALTNIADQQKSELENLHVSIIETEEKHQAERSEFIQRITELRSITETLTNERDAVKAERDTARASRDTYSEKLENLTQKHQKSIEENLNALEKLQTHYDSFLSVKQKKIGSLENSNADLQSVNDSLKARNEGLTNELKSGQDVQDQLKEEISTRDKVLMSFGSINDRVLEILKRAGDPELLSEIRGIYSEAGEDYEKRFNEIAGQIEPESDQSDHSADEEEDDDPPINK